MDLKSPSSISEAPRRAVPTILFLLLAWLSGLAYLAFRFVEAGLDEWNSAHSPQTGDGRAEAGADRADLLMVLFAVVVVAGPVLIAAVAAYGRMRKTLIGFGILAGLLAVVALVVGALATRDLARSMEPASNPPARCVEYSGGEASCPDVPSALPPVVRKTLWMTSPGTAMAVTPSTPVSPPMVS